MKTTSPSTASDTAFSRTDLIVVVAFLALLAALVLPAFAGTKSLSFRAGCLANLMRLQIAAEMYRVEYNDVLIPNSPSGSPFNTWVSNSVVNWGTSTWNTNAALYGNTLIGRYLNTNLSVLRCPADVIPSSNGVRMRSYSMNGQIGDFYQSALPSSWRTYTKGSDLVCPTPAGAFVFLDETPYSLNDGYFALSLSVPGYPDVPANYMDGGCGFSFADGHAEYRRWSYRTLDPNAGLRNTPYASGVVGTGSPKRASTGLDFDWFWLRQRAACVK